MNAQLALLEAPAFWIVTVAVVLAGGGAGITAGVLSSMRPLLTRLLGRHDRRPTVLIAVLRPARGG